MINLDTLIEEVPKIGLAYQKKLKKLGVKTVQDLFFYFPSRYDDFSNIIPIDKVKLGQICCIQGKISEIKNTRTFKKFMNITQALIEDQTGSIRTLWFNQPYLTKTLKENDSVCLAGKVSLGKDGIYLNNPVYEKLPDTPDPRQYLVHTGRIVPVYPETRGVTSRWLRFIIKNLLPKFYHRLPEIIPAEIIKKYKFLPIKKAIWQIHFPDSFEYANLAKKRFSFAELFLLQLSVLKERMELNQQKSLPCSMNTELMKDFTNSLPFLLTDSQKKCSYQILKDLEKSRPMSRLLQGDVGSGKTVVAAMAVLNVIKSGCQVAFMSPTEILAKQHFSSITKLLESFDVTIGLLTAKENKIYRDKKFFDIKKQSLLEDLKNGVIGVLIGTHALISKGVEFKNLVLVIVDEQHRFGVEQRAQLTKNSNLIPHLLSMTATPIPRTLALTVYGDLDLSLIKEMPKDRKQVKTFIVEPKARNRAHEFIRKEAKEGKGIFVICPRIEIGSSQPLASLVSGGNLESGRLFPYAGFNSKIWDEVKAVKEEFERLSKKIFPDLKVVMLHGKMKTKEKEKAMEDFKNGRSDILVSTSVVEVGVDVPRATVMVIEGAERFGLAQLHQFRGRVGRSDLQSYCFLFTTSPDQLNRKRLKALAESNNGFELAQKDLEIRGPGQLYGTQQWGLGDFAMQGLLNLPLVEMTRNEAKEILEKDPNLRQHPLLKEHLSKFEKRIHFE